LARMRGPRFKKCRSLNLNVCGHPKAMKRANNGQARDAKKLSPYGVQLLEKQRLRGYYEVMEKQFKRYVISAKKSQEQTGIKLVQTLECRLDNMVYRMNFARSIRQARQMVVHGHLLVNGKKVTVPSYAVAVGDVVTLRESSKEIANFHNNFYEMRLFSLPYITYDDENYAAILDRRPQRDEIPIEIKDHLVVEFYATLTA